MVELLHTKEVDLTSATGAVFSLAQEIAETNPPEGWKVYTNWDIPEVNERIQSAELAKQENKLGPKVSRCLQTGISMRWNARKIRPNDTVFGWIEDVTVKSPDSNIIYIDCGFDMKPGRQFFHYVRGVIDKVDFPISILGFNRKIDIVNRKAVQSLPILISSYRDLVSHDAKLKSAAEGYTY